MLQPPEPVGALGVEPTVPHPALLNPVVGGSDGGGAKVEDGDPTVAQPDPLNPLGFVSVSAAEGPGAGVTTGLRVAAGLAILIPAALASFLSSFSSLFLSFSLRLSISSFEPEAAREASCISRKRALW